VLGDRGRLREGHLSFLERGPELPRIVGEEEARPVIKEPRGDIRRGGGLTMSGGGGLIASRGVLGGGRRPG